MPRISAFYGILIAMYHDDHPPPHFHAIYGEHEARIAIDSLQVIEGWLPTRAARLVREWGALHRAELIDNWERARLHIPLDKIDPLP